jgi:hypothetical protein
VETIQGQTKRATLKLIFMYYIKDKNMSIDFSKPPVRHDFEQPGADIVLELAKQITEDMIPICNTTCESTPAAIVETLLNRETVKPILDKLRAGRGSRVNFKSTWNPVLVAKITAVKSIPTDTYVKFLNSNQMFVDSLSNFICESKCDVEKLTNYISNLVLEPYRANITELCELKGKSAGGRKQKSRHGHKQKSRRGHKTRRHKRRFTRKH